MLDETRAVVRRERTDGVTLKRSFAGHAWRRAPEKSVLRSAFVGRRPRRQPAHSNSGNRPFKVTVR